MGRPRRDPDEPATLRAVAWVVPAEHALMRELARLRGCSVSELLRQLVAEETARVRARPGRRARAPVDHASFRP